MFSSMYLDFIMSVPEEYRNVASVLFLLFNLELLLGCIQIYLVNSLKNDYR